jgi:hypothetical protein
MKRQLLLLLTAVLFLLNYSDAQSTANYTRTSDATGSLYSMAGSVPLIAASQNNKASELVEIGFDFYFMGVRYVNFSVNSNGAMQLGNNIINTGYIGTSFPSANAIIAPFLGDLRTSSTGKVHCTNIGAYPNRKLVVEWLNMGVNNSSSSADATFQVVLTETSGVIQFIYGDVKIGSGASATKTIVGFCSNSTANNVLSIAHNSPWAVNTGASPTSQTYNSVGVTNFNSAANGSRVDLYFTPPVRTAPVMLVNTGTTTTSTNVNWTDLALNELAYVVYFSDDGGLSYTFYKQYAANTATSAVSPLLAGKTYVFKAFSLSEGALSNTTALGTVTLGSCGSITTNTATFTTTSANWSALTWSAGHVPTPCENAVLICNRNTTGTESITVTLDVDVAVNSLTFSNISPKTGTLDRKYFNINGDAVVQIANDLVLTCTGGNKYNRCTYACQDRTFINGNVILGSTTPTATEGYSSIGSNGNSPGQFYLLRGNMTYNKRAYTTDEHAVFTFDKNGTQYIYNNIPLGTADTLQALLFEKLNIGMSYAPTVILSGTGGNDGYIETADRGGVYINNGATLELPQNYSFNALGGSNYFKMMPNSTLKLGGDASIIDPFTGTAFGVAGSNFPGGFTSWVLDPTATVEYNGSNAITQTIYAGVTYPKLILTNGSGTGRAAKITTAAVTVNDFTTINNGADVTLGAAWSNGGAYNVLTNGGLYCAANVVSGTGAFTLNNLSFLGIGHAQGIASGSTTAGNIQMMGGRSFSTSGNYIYYGTINQITGNGLPTTCNNLTINNTAASGSVTMTPTTAQLVNGTHLISAGTFKVGTNNRVTIGASAIMNVTGTGLMEVDKGILEFAGNTGTAQNLDGAWFVGKTISTLIDNNTKGITVAATLNDSLHIASALLYGTGITNSTITTNNNISLLSRDTATARFGEIVTGSGNAIAGNVNVERYLPTQRKWRHLAIPIGSNQTVRDAWMEKNAVANGNTKAGYGTIVTDDLATAVAQNFDSRSVSGPSVKYYNPVTNTYTSITNPSTFNINSQNSYYNFVRGDRSCIPANSAVSTTILRTTGTLKTGNQVFSVLAGKYASIGNPYASSIDLRKLDTVNLTSTFYVWDPKLTGTYGLGAYQTLYKSGTEYRVMPGGGSYGALNSFVDTLESGQAFFVRAGASAGTLTVKENAKTIGARAMSRIAPGESGFTSGGPQAVYSLLSLVDPGETTLVDGAMAAYDPAFSNSVDYDDALKMTNTSENVSIKREGSLLAIERRQTITVNDTIFLNLTGLRVHQYKWELILDNMDAPGLTALFVDKYLTASTPLTMAGTNTVLFDVVNIAGAYAPDRFMIVFKPAAIVPVRFTTISAVRNADKTVAVSWNAENETAMQNYIVERSFDGRSFTAVGTLLPTSNNGGSAAYHFNDATASEGDNYYRVRGNSITGRIDYTSIVKVGPLKQNPGMSIYPNPVTDNTVNLKLTNLPKGAYQMQVINNLGQVILSTSLQLQNGNTVKSIQLPPNMAAGNYRLKVTDSADKITTISFMVQ